MITVFVYELLYPRAQFRILVGGTGRDVPSSFRSVPGFSNDPPMPSRKVYILRKVLETKL